MDKPTILIVDDEPINLSMLKNLLADRYQVRACKRGEEAVRAVNVEPRPDLVLLDIMMPDLDGYEVLARIKQDPVNRAIPVIFVSALDGIVDEEKGFQLGAVDYITKPFRSAIVLERVRVHLELKRARDILKDQNEWLEAEVGRRLKENQLIQDLTLTVITELADTRDAETAHHILRTRSYVEILGRHLQRQQLYANELTEAYLNNIVKASPLHDIGKIGIPDAILLKPGRLTEAEFEIMKRHCSIGGQAIRSAIDKALAMNRSNLEAGKPMSLQFLEVAKTIADHHHEKWDGSGYPYGLSGEAIPISAQLVSIADVYDALVSERPYKKAYSHEQAVEILLNGDDRLKPGSFSPKLIQAFLRCEKKLKKLYFPEPPMSSIFAQPENGLRQ